jgi:acyl carrier protein
MSENVTEFICDWVFDKTEVRIEETQDLFLVGRIDSLLFAELIEVVENKLSIMFNFSELDDWESVRTPIGLARIAKS